MLKSSCKPCRSVSGMRYNLHYLVRTKVYGLHLDSCIYKTTIPTFFPFIIIITSENLTNSVPCPNRLLHLIVYKSHISACLINIYMQIQFQLILLQLVTYWSVVHLRKADLLKCSKKALVLI